jgi:hypothetical protein
MTKPTPKERVIVRCQDRTVFEIDPSTLEAKTCSYYDAYCFDDPLTDVQYVSYSDWLTKVNASRRLKGQKHG